MVRKLGKTGFEINPIGFGGIPIQRLSFEDSDRLLEEAVKNGVNFYDSSRVYTDSEEKMGRILSKFRDKVFIATKSYNREKQGILRDIEVSLKKFKTDYIDLYQLHNIGNYSQLNKALGKDGALEGLIQAKEEGYIKAIGITGHKPWIIKSALQQFEFDTIQIPCNIIEIKCFEDLVPFAKEQNTGIIAMKPVAGGALKNVVLNLRFILTNNIDVVIPGMDKVKQVKENLSVLENMKPLNEQEKNILNKEKEELGEEFCRRCEYCMPCPEGLNIPFLHLLGAYYFRYDLKEWAWERLNSLDKKYTDCTKCRECIEKCPYDLDMPYIFEKIHEKIMEDRKNRKD